MFGQHRLTIPIHLEAYPLQQFWVFKASMLSKSESEEESCRNAFFGDQILRSSFP